MKKKFNEAINTAVFTTKYVLAESPIVYVSHDLDGDWQFLSSEKDLSDEDLRVVGLGEIIKRDDSVIEIADLPIGHQAVRKDKDGIWRIIFPGYNYAIENSNNL